MMLFNTKNNTWHTIYFVEKPFPGEGVNKVVRYKSKGHHTTGFDTKEKAIDSISGLIDNIASVGMYQKPTIDIEGYCEWDGNGIPAMVELRAN